MGAILDAALEYAQAGYAVIPVTRAEKKPYTINGLDDATTDLGTIRLWWSWWPNANVAVVCGKVSGFLFAIDVDIKPEKGKHGDESLKTWEAQHGDFPETVRQVTGSGGYHYFFRSPDIVKYKNKIDALPGIDIRGDGAYVVVSPSIYEDGRTYLWEHEVSILDSLEIADANDSVMDLLKQYPRYEETGTLPTKKRELISMRNVPEGSRNSVLYSAACALCRYDFPYDAALTAILQANSSWKHPLPEFEVRKTFESAYSHQPNEVNIYSVNNVTAQYDENGEYIPKLPPSIPIESIVNPPPLKPPIIGGLLREGEAMLMSGPPKAGKSFLICLLALSVASGVSWVGQTCKKKKVLYIDAELALEVAVNRLHDIWRKCDTSIPVFPENLEVKSTKNNSVSLGDIADDIEHAPGKYDLVIVDPLYMFIDSDQNDNTQMKREMEMIKRIYATGASVIVNHHTTKGLQNGKMSIDRASGAGVISRFFDSILTLNLLQPEEGDIGRPERIEADTRSFKQPLPINLWFVDGLHIKDNSGELIFRQLLDPKKETNDRKVDDIVKRVNHCYSAMLANGKLTDGCFTVDDFTEAYEECYGKGIARTTAREHLEKAGYIKKPGEKAGMRNGKPFKTKVTFYFPDGGEVPDDSDENSSK